MTELITLLVNTITSVLIKPLAQKGAEELGKNVSGDLYTAVKKIFVTSKQQAIISKLEEDPLSEENQDDFEKEFIEILSNCSDVSHRIKDILPLMPINVTLFQRKWDVFETLKYQLDLNYIKWAADNPREVEELYQEKRSRLERKLQIIHKEMSDMLKATSTKGAL